MEEWTDWRRGGGGVLNWRMGDQWGARATSSASQSVTYLTVKGKQQQHLVKDRNTSGIFLSLSMAAQAMAQGVHSLLDNLKQ